MDKIKTLHRRLSVFEDHFDGAAAEYVCGFEPLDHLDVQHGLRILLEHNAIQPSPADSLTMLSAAAEPDEDEHAILQRRHMEWFVGMLESTGGALPPHDQDDWFDRLDRLRGSMRAALREASRPSVPKEFLLRLIAALGRYWTLRAYIEEGLEWTMLAIDRDKQPDGPLGLRALNIASVLLDMQGKHDDAVRVQREMIEHGRRLGDVESEAIGCMNLATALRNLNRLEEAYKVMREAIPQIRQLGDPRKLSSTLINATAMCLDLKRPEAAAPMLREAAEIVERTGDSWSQAYISYNYARLYRERDQLERAQGYFEDALWIFYKLRDTRNVGDCLRRLAEIAESQGAHGRSAILVGAAALAQDISGGATPVFELKSELISVVRTRLVLGDAEFDRHWEEGHEMPLEEAVKLAGR